MSGLAFLEGTRHQDTPELQLLVLPLPREFPTSPRQSLLASQLPAAQRPALQATAVHRTSAAAQCVPA
jgi:hypothetical protein